MQFSRARGVSFAVGLADCCDTPATQRELKYEKSMAPSSRGGWKG